jgi:hypothetical protein
MADTKLPIWANNDLATYSAFTGLPADLTSAAPKAIDPQKSIKGLEFMPGADDSSPGTYRMQVPTPAGWDPTVKVYANYDSTGNLSNFSGSNPVFPADANGKLSGQSKYNPIWDASGKAAPVQDTSKGGWAGTPAVMQMLSMIPATAPFMAALNAANGLSKGKLDTSTILSGLTAATGLGSSFGLDPSTLATLKTAQQVAGGVNAVEKGNVSGMVNALLQVTSTGNQDTNTAIQAINAATALKKNDFAGAMSALSGLTGSGDLKVASTAASILQSLNPSGTPKLGFGQSATPTATPQGATATQPAAQAPQTAQAPQSALVAAPVVGNMVALDQFGVKNPFLGAQEKQIVTDTGYAHGGSVEDLLRILRS